MSTTPGDRPFHVGDHVNVALGNRTLRGKIIEPEHPTSCLNPSAQKRVSLRSTSKFARASLARTTLAVRMRSSL